MRNELIARIENKHARSAWGRGVKAYALELLDSYPDDLPRDIGALEIALLNGARDWKQYSDGGCALVYDADIAARLCTPSELRRVRGGDRQPNGRESWIDVQARALYQAWNLIACAAWDEQHKPA